MSIYYGYDYSAPNDYLAHYGIPGMRWGHRKQRIKARTERRLSRIQNKKGVSRAEAGRILQRRQMRKAGLLIGAGAGLAAVAGSKRGNQLLSNAIGKARKTKLAKNTRHTMAVGASHALNYIQRLQNKRRGAIYSTGRVVG